MKSLTDKLKIQINELSYSLKLANEKIEEFNEANQKLEEKIQKQQKELQKIAKEMVKLRKQNDELQEFEFKDNVIQKQFDIFKESIYSNSESPERLVSKLHREEQPVLTDKRNETILRNFEQLEKNVTQLSVIQFLQTAEKQDTRKVEDIFKERQKDKAKLEKLKKKQAEGRLQEISETQSESQKEEDRKFEEDSVYQFALEAAGKAE